MAQVNVLCQPSPGRWQRRSGHPVPPMCSPLGANPHGQPGVLLPAARMAQDRGVLPAARMAKDRWAMASLMAAPSCVPFRMARACQWQWLCSSFLSSSWKMSRTGRRQEESPILISLLSSLRMGEEKAAEKELSEV